MTRQAPTFDEVATAAGSLHNDGKQAGIEAISGLLGNASAAGIHKHLTAWRASHAKPAEAPRLDIPEPIVNALGNWVRQFAEEASAGVREALAQAESDVQALLKSGEQLEAERDQALATVAEHGESIERLTVELRNARHVATEALVGKAKDQLAIEGKDSQLADLRLQIERNVAASAAQSDARLAAEMELIGAVTARDNFEAELRELRGQLDVCRAERNTLRA
ncbi:DNA-binding protein [Undibacterium sp. TJN25]|uniref:DNA-binding protein n=1 Tax=Undibacterium sp. TJN25 TaxID=3413056 RepID=UPI003BF1D9B2